MRAMKTDGNSWMENARQLTLPRLAMAAVISLALAFSFSGCVNVAGYTQPTLVRVIDASYVAPAVNVVVEGTLLASNIGQGTITPYGTLTANAAAPIKVTAAAGTTALVTASGMLLAGHQAPKTGPVDVYMVPSGTTQANTIPLVTALPVGTSASYISFTSQTVTMVITPTGVTTSKYTSASLALTGGEVRTVLIIDTQLTSNPPVEVFMGNDVN
jgi:hypothetical protein